MKRNILKQILEYIKYIIGLIKLLNNEVQQKDDGCDLPF